MKILGIETSCDETGAAIIEAYNIDEPVRLLSNSLATSLAIHATTGGIIPEIAAREQVKYILPVIRDALKNADMSFDAKPPIDAIAVTYGPGLIGSLLVGVETAKTLAYLWDLPIIPVNHLYGHIYANFIRELPVSNFQFPVSNFSLPQFPALALVVSGGHTDLVLMKNHGDLQVIGGTRDDAAGEAFDKIGRLLGLPYPAGPQISRLAQKGNPKAFRLPRPMWDSKDFDFSFSGLKTSVLNLVKKNNWDFTDKEKNAHILADLSYAVQDAIVDVLVFKTLQAAKEYQVKTLIMGGGVAANKALRDGFLAKIALSGNAVQFQVPPMNLCTDNAAMIAAAGFYNQTKMSWDTVTVNPELYY